MAGSTQIKVDIPNYMKFVLGGLAGMGATCFVQPFDLVKNRMQMRAAVNQQTGTLLTFRTVYQNEGLLALYNGISAGLLRQATYTTMRLGLYTWLFDVVQSQNSGKSPNFASKAAIGVFAGAVSSFIGTPTEVSLIRMTSDGKLPEAQRRNYKNVFDALFRIIKEEGVLTLWRGCGPTVVRAMIVNAAQLATYSQAKELLIKSGYFKDNINLHFSASMISGFVTTAVSMPVDMAKTRLQNMQVIDGKPEYKGSMDVCARVVRKHGVLALWKGFTPYFARLGSQTVLIFIFLEQLNGAYYKYVLKTEKRGGGL